jgi:hypothetical protein
VADDVIVPVFDYPLRMQADGTPAVVEQGSLEDVRASIHMLMRTPRGSRPLAPDIGVDDPTFGPGVDGDELAADLEAQEPLAALTVTVSPGDGPGDEVVRVEVDLALEDEET